MLLLCMCVLAQVCLLAPQSAAQMLAFVVVTFVDGEAPRLGATVNGKGINNTGIATQLMTNLKNPTVGQCADVSRAVG